MRPKNLPGAWVLLMLMVCIESFSTMMLKQSDGFQILTPTLIALVGFFTVLLLFSFVLNVIPASVAYAVWTGLGTLLVVIAGWVFFGEELTFISIFGITLVVVGVILINRIQDNTQ